MKTKISVDKLVISIAASSGFSFDYMMLAVVASLLAGVGLATDNTVRQHQGHALAWLPIRLNCVPLLLSRLSSSRACWCHR